MQEGRHAHNNESTSMNASPQNNVPNKHVLENVIDFLQRKDQDDLFGEPVNHDTEPMDFGTMRAKVHEGMYTSLEQFKRDVILLCFNAMNAYPETSRYHKVAEDIGCHAVNVFEDLKNAQHEKLNLKSSSNKERRRGNNIVRSKVSGTEKRLMYWPPCNMSLFSEFINAPKPNIQLSPINYKDSLLRFVKDCGPIAQKVAAKKLEGLKFQQSSNANNSNVADKNIFINNGYQAFASALMHTSVYDNAEKGKNPIGSEISYANGILSNNSILNRNMVSKVGNVFNMIRQQNFLASNLNIPISGSSVHPTSVISRPHENPF
ncbi:hypothetical protein TSUD_126800 [Trifolium subterraneum]|nr:hypothetical protein TSUD_126800 [Trifolium subterraneum]